MNFFEYFDAGHAIITGLTALAALTPTLKDDHVLGRVKNLFDIARKYIRFPKR
jgi:hypothetical protein